MTTYGMSCVGHLWRQFPFTTVGLAVLALVVLNFLSQIVRYRFFSPLKDFPGPFWASVTRLWIARHCARSTELATCQRLHQKYGPVIRITPTMLLVSDATKIPEIYHRQADKTNHYIAFSAAFEKNEGVQHKMKHHDHVPFRKNIAGPYSMTSVRKMEPLVDARIQHWISALEKRFAMTGETFDFAPWAVYIAYDLISEVGFGAPLGFVDKGEDIDGLIQGFHDGLTIFGLMCRLYPLTAVFKDTWLGEKLLVSKLQDHTGVGVLMRFRDKLLDQRIKDIKAGADTRADLLQTFFDARTENGKPFDLDYIKAEVLNVLLAGADTTGTSFQSIVYYVMSKPAVYARLMEELDSVTRAGLLPANTIPRYDDVAAHCPYYIACVREAMRVCPPAPNLFPRLVSQGGMQLGDHWAPEGTEVICNPYLTHRDTNVYGPDAEEFRPKRWLDERVAKEYNKYNLVFGYGSRICLGKDLAMMELYKAPLQFFRTFKPDVRNKEKPGKFNVWGGVGFWSNLWLTISPRDQVVVGIDI